MYIEQICLAVLFFLKISDGIVFIVEGVLMVILMALTLSAQILYRRSFLREYQSLSCPRLLQTLGSQSLIAHLSSHYKLPANVARNQEDAGTMGARAEAAS
jgi:hypothetical protein